MKRNFLLAVTLIILLTGCGSSGGGGGGNSGGSTPTPTPIAPSTPTPSPPVPVPSAPDVPFNTSDPHNKTPAENQGLDGTNTVVGIIDSNFNPTNPEFSNSLGGSRLIVDGNFTGNNNSHGSLVAEIIGGKRIGIAPNITMQAVSAGVTCSNGEDECVDATRSMYDTLYNKGVRIFNQSFGSGDDNILTASKNNYPLSDPVINFYQQKTATDSLFIWATGNSKSPQPGAEAGLPYLYPSLQKGWLAVTAVNSQTGLISDYANRCGAAMNWCLAAVGDYDFYVENVTGKGTSFSAPAVTGAAGLVKQKYSWMNGDLIRQTLLSTATDKGDLGVDKVYGWGLLNIGKAVNGPALFDKRLALADYVYVTFDAVTSKFENDISGDAGLVKNGTGTLILTGNNTYTGQNVVNGGILQVNGKVLSQVNVKKNGVLSSDGGSIGNDVINEGGTFINKSNGTIINGNYLASNDSITESDVDATIKIKGKAILSGSQLKINSPKDENNNPVYVSANNGITNKIIVADNGIENHFNSIDTPVLLESKVKYNPNNIELNLERKNVSVYASKAYNSDATRDNSSENLEQVFKVLDNTTGKDKFKTQAALLQQSSAKTLAVTLDSLSGQIYASAQALTFQQSQTINKDLSNRLVMLGSLEGNNDNSAGLWFNGIGSVGKLYESGYAEADTYLYGGQIGIDKSINADTILGIALSFSDSKADFNRYAGESKSQNVGLSIYGRYGKNDDSFYLLGRLGGAYVASDVERDVIIGTNTENLSIDHNDYVLSGYGEVGYKFKTSKNTNVTPFAGLMYDSVSRGSFSEDNSLFGLEADRKTYDQTSGLLGLRAETNFNWFAGRTTLQGYFSWQWAFNDEDLSFEASYVGLSNEKFKVKGIGLSRDTAWVGIGTLTEINSNWAWYANYDMQIESSKTTNNVFSVGARLTLN